MGAADVVPFVPVADISIEECVELAKDVGRRVAAELVVPVYLYGYAATRPDRIKLADIRTGQYEALAEKIKDPDFAPDFGPAEFNARTGATVIGVRNFLLAYNVNLTPPTSRPPKRSPRAFEKRAGASQTTQSMRPAASRPARRTAGTSRPTDALR